MWNVHPPIKILKIVDLNLAQEPCKYLIESKIINKSIIASPGRAIYFLLKKLNSKITIFKKVFIK